MLLLSFGFVIVVPVRLGARQEGDSVVWSFVAGAGRLSWRVAVTALADALSFSLLDPWLNPLPATAEPVAERQETGS